MKYQRNIIDASLIHAKVHNVHRNIFLCAREQFQWKKKAGNKNVIHPQIEIVHCNMEHA